MAVCCVGISTTSLWMRGATSKTVQSSMQLGMLVVAIVTPTACAAHTIHHLAHNRTSPTGLPAHTRIGKHVTIGAGCTLRSCTVESEVIVGARSILMEGSYVEKHSVLEPGTVVPPGRLIPSGQVWGGNPAHYIRDLTKDEVG